MAVSVWPSSKKIEQARTFAQEVAGAGELRVVQWSQEIGFVSLAVLSPEKSAAYWVNIRPVHFGGYDAKVFDFNMLRHIEFEYHPEGITEEVAYRHPFDPSTYLMIKNVR